MTDKDKALGALLLSALMQAPDSDLPKLRRQRLGRGSEIDLAHLLRAREILLKLHDALVDDDEQSWQAVHDAWKALHRTDEDDTRTVDDEGVVRDPAPVVEEPPAEEPASTTEEAPAAKKRSSWAEPTEVSATADGPGSKAEELPGLAQLAKAPPIAVAAPLPAAPPPAAGPSPWAQHEYAGSGHGGPPSSEPVDPVASTQRGGSPYAQPPPAAAAAGAGGRPSAGTTSMPITPAISTLPFAGQVAPPPASADVGEKLFTGTLDAPDQPVSASPLPFAGSEEVAAATAGVNGMPVAGYAALCAVCEVMPALAGITHTVYGVRGEKGRQELDEAFKQHFAANPEASELWHTLRDQLRSWLERHCGG